MKKIVLFISILLLSGCGSSSENLDINSKQVQSLYQMVNPSEDADVLGYLYQSSDEFQNPYILATAFNYYLKNQNEKIEFISEEKITEMVHFIFGEIPFYHEKVYLFNGDYCGFLYNDSLARYESLHGCDGNMYVKFYRKIIDAKKENDTIYIREKSFFVYNDWEAKDPYITVYNNITDKHVINRYPALPNGELNITINDYLDDASTYQYVFKKIQDRYIFSSINLIY